jgi:transcriptional regulator with XRE-family HTH domain
LRVIIFPNEDFVNKKVYKKGVKLTIVDRMREFLSEMGLRPADISRETGISTSALSLYLSGKRNPSQQALLKLNSIYNINTNWLLTGEGPKFLGRGNDEDQDSASNKRNNENSEVAKWKEKCLEILEENRQLRKENDVLKAKL